MRGQVLHYDDFSGQGLISGADGQRYRFARADLQQLRPIAPGDEVDFVVNADRAEQIYLISGSAGQAPPQAAYGAQPTYQQPAYAAVSGPPEQLGLFGYFGKCMRLYFNGEGRARRAEYWSFVLFQLIITLIALAIFYSQLASAAVRYGAYGGYGYNSRFAAYAAAGDISGLVLLAFGLLILSLILLPPTITVTVRRLHDVGLSGWLVLLGLIPVFGALFLFVVSLIPGQRGANKHGPDPKGDPNATYAPA